MNNQDQTPKGPAPAPLTGTQSGPIGPAGPVDSGGNPLGPQPPVIGAAGPNTPPGNVAYTDPGGPNAGSSFFVGALSSKTTSTAST